jgi:hypothetical protein
MDDRDRELLARAVVIAGTAAVTVLSGAGLLGLGWRLFRFAAG